MGLALAQAPGSAREGKESAKRALRKALSLDPLALRPLLALVELHTVERDYDACVELLSGAIERGAGGRSCPTSFGGWVGGGGNGGGGAGGDRHHARDLLHTKLADVHALNENYSEALARYHTAVSMNPENVGAQRGLDRLERLMRGMDPDDEEPSDEIEEDEEEDDEHDMREEIDSQDSRGHVRYEPF